MRYVPIIFALLFGITSYSQTTQEIFESFKLQERRDVHYYFPEKMDENKKYPLIIVLDAEYLFEQVVASSKFYSRFHGMPQSIVVGIDQSKNDLRFEDCAFDPDSGLPSEKGKSFYEFIGMELIPYLDLNYSTAPFKMIVGYDISASFMNYWLFKDNSIFDAFISISPTLAPEMESRVPMRLNTFENQIFYQLIVEGEDSNDKQRIIAMNNSIKAIEKESLHYFFDEYTNADHISVATYGIGKAFDNIFGMFKPISPKEYKTQILTSEEPVFDYLEKKYQDAIPVLSSIVKLNPMLLDSYEWLAQCFKDGGDSEQALQVIQRAVKHSHLSIPRQRLLAELALDTKSLDIAKEAFFSILMQTKNTIHQDAQHLINYIQAIILVAKFEEDGFKRGRLLQEISGLFHRAAHQHPYVDQDELSALEGYSMASIHKAKGNKAKAKHTLFNSNQDYLEDPRQIPDWLGPQLVHLLTELEEHEHAEKCKPFIQHANVHSEKLLNIIAGTKDHSQAEFNQHNKLGIKAFTSGQLEQALKHFEDALSLAPLNSGATLNKVQVCLALLKKLNRPWPQMTQQIADIFTSLEDFPLVEQQKNRKMELKKEFNNQRMHEKHQLANKK